MTDDQNCSDDLENRKQSVEHPKHYKGDGIECIDVIEAFKLNFNLGNAIKYILRAGKKGCMLTDLEKARWYLEREMENHSEK